MNLVGRAVYGIRNYETRILIWEMEPQRRTVAFCRDVYSFSSERKYANIPFPWTYFLITIRKNEYSNINVVFSDQQLNSIHHKARLVKFSGANYQSNHICLGSANPYYEMQKFIHTMNEFSLDFLLSHAFIESFFGAEFTGVSFLKNQTSDKNDWYSFDQLNRMGSFPDCAYGLEKKNLHYIIKKTEHYKTFKQVTRENTSINFRWRTRLRKTWHLPGIF